MLLIYSRIVQYSFTVYYLLLEESAQNMHKMHTYAKFHTFHFTLLLSGREKHKINLTSDFYRLTLFITIQRVYLYLTQYLVYPNKSLAHCKRRKTSAIYDKCVKERLLPLHRKREKISIIFTFIDCHVISSFRQYK